MKGMIFTEYIDFVATSFGDDVCETMISGSRLPNEGAYTAVGTYDHKELVKMVIRLSELTQTPTDTLVKAYGFHLFGVLASKYHVMVHGIESSFDLFRQIEDVIHVEVRKLYPDAELPTFGVEEPSPKEMVLHYRSERGLADVAEGLIKGCLSHFGEDATIEREDLSGAPGTSVKFHITKQ